MSERNGTDQSNDGAPSVEVTEDDIFEEMNDHQDILAASCGDDVGVEHFSIVIQAACGLLHMLVRETAPINPFLWEGTRSVYVPNVVGTRWVGVVSHGSSFFSSSRHAHAHVSPSLIAPLCTLSLVH